MRLVFALALLVSLASQAEEISARPVLFVVDISGSMHEMLPRIKAAISNKVDSPQFHETETGLITFSGCGKGSASVAVPLGKNNAEKIKRVAQSLEAAGSTDIVQGLTVAKEVIEKLIQEKRECGDVLLFTDHFDTCNNGEQHHQMVKEISEMCQKMNSTFTLDVIGLTNDEDTLIYLEKLAGVAQGDIFTAVGWREIEKALETIFSKKEKNRQGLPRTSTIKKVEAKEKPQEAKKPLPQKDSQPAKNQQSNGQTKSKEASR